jgi:T5SS/PEP-CTERM-associated repeat protein
MGQDNVTDSAGTVTVSGAGSVWHVLRSLDINQDSFLSIEPGSTVRVRVQLIPPYQPFPTYGIRLGGTLNLAGGTLDLNGHQFLSADTGPAEFSFTDGLLKNVGTIDLGGPLVQLGGTLAPGGSIGVTDIIGGYNLNAGTLEIELGGSADPHDLVTVTGDIDIALTGTTLDLSALGAMAAATYTVLESTNGTLTGRFEHVTGIAMYPGLVDITYTANAITITLNRDFVPGDLDGDAFVGITDLNILLTNWNRSVTAWDLLSGDANGDGFVGITDFNTVLGNWNTSIPPEAGAPGPVPEPGTLGVLGMLGCMLTRRRPAC